MIHMLPSEDEIFFSHANLRNKDIHVLDRTCTLDSQISFL